MFFKDVNAGMAHKLRTNVTKFATYKAYHVTKVLKNILNDDKIPFKEKEEYQKKALKIFDRWQKTEQNTTVTRAITAKQFEQFMQEDNKRLFPNLRWLPSLSVNKREQHKVFYNRVWAKGDPFWNHNTPGSLWNCKCDWEETSDPPTSGNPKTKVAAPGLDVNPGKKGEVFTDKASYIRKGGKEATRSVIKYYYKDYESDLPISVLADLSEVDVNIRTGRVLINNKDIKTIEIRPHVFVHREKNPEYLINGVVADAKRLESWNVKSAFNRAIGQECRIVVIDLFEMETYKLNIQQLAQGITDRHEDFITNKIKSCFVVWKDRSVKIDAGFFDGFNEKEKWITTNAISKELYKLILNE